MHGLYFLVSIFSVYRGEELTQQIDCETEVVSARNKTIRRGAVVSALPPIDREDRPLREDLMVRDDNNLEGLDFVLHS